ncbi:hypothetical protein [Novosphingopyxis sp.]|uniref:hypothetical protein n=1 Tax=Novosphingopyxis sp. TaxID=2709690 RepID=UPI003B59BE3E
MVSKPQLFRAEWVGLVEAEGNWGFVAGDAAHPHWQFDALDTFAQEEERDFAVELRQLLRGETQLPTPDPEIQVTEFSFLGEETSPLEIGDDDIGLLVRHRKVSAIHFPSVAPWWLDKSDHAHMPGNAGHVRLWLDKTLRYVRTELSRV